MKHLSALIRSKGYDPPEAKRGGLSALQKRWEDVKNEPNWVRTEYFTEDEQKDTDDDENAGQNMLN